MLVSSTKPPTIDLSVYSSSRRVPTKNKNSISKRVDPCRIPISIGI